MENMIPFLLEGLWSALKLALLTLLFALPLGLLVARGRMSRCKWIQYPIRVYLLIMRGTPLMLQLMLVYFGPGYIAKAMGVSIDWDRSVAAVVAFVINYAAYFAEIYRGGIESIPKGQYEAGAVLGFTKMQTFMRIVLPQVVKRILPPMGSEFMVLIKDTALAKTIGYAELLRNADSIASREFSIVPLLVAGLFYLIMNTIVEQGFNMAEKKLNYYR
ncbi:MAG: amino acid ABC transporter permease [Clostridia bacterium]|nr:amino acid ABC transporter permease [Clostridia bacterium]MBR0025642.1 amino acid ABC transporter permease [Clostridia bacterium]